MKKFATMSGAELVALYTQIGVAQAEALDRFESERFNRLIDNPEKLRRRRRRSIDFAQRHRAFAQPDDCSSRQ